MSMNPFSRIAAMILFFETWGRRNYTNTISIIPDELIGTWVIESSNGYCSSSEAKTTKLILHPDQTFEIVCSTNVYIDNQNIATNTQRKYANPYSNKKEEMIHFYGKWETISHKSSFFNPANCTIIVGRYGDEKEYVSLGQVLDRHVSSSQNRFAIKWFRAVDESCLGPDKGVYLKKSPAKLDI